MTAKKADIIDAIKDVLEQRLSNGNSCGASPDIVREHSKLFGSIQSTLANMDSKLENIEKLYNRIDGINLRVTTIEATQNSKDSLINRIIAYIALLVSMIVAYFSAKK